MKFIDRLLERLTWTSVTAARSVYAITYHMAKYMGPLVARLCGHVIVIGFSLFRFAVDISRVGATAAIHNLVDAIAWVSTRPGFATTFSIIFVLALVAVFSIILSVILAFCVILISIIFKYKK